jgi:hypothetical protein
MANHIVTYHDDSQPAKEGKAAVPATKAWATCSCSWKSMEIRNSLEMNRPGLQRLAKKHLEGKL